MSLVVTDLQKRYRGAARPALDGVSFSLPAGSVASILGGSGAGKTTLLRCMTGLEEFSRGSIEVDGVKIELDGTEWTHATRERVLRKLRGRTGIVFQSYELFPHLSLLENCTLAPRIVRGVPENDARDRARALLDRLGLSAHADQHPDSLSGGQKQRAAIARALAMEPRVLFYDEPTSALDPALRLEVRRTIDAVAATGITQVLVTHDLPFARDASTTVLVLDGGRIVEQGPTADVFAKPAHEKTRELVTHSGM